MTSPSFRIVWSMEENNSPIDGSSILIVRCPPPPRLAFAVFDMVRKEGKVMYPHRYDFKARAREEDLNRGVIGSPMRGLSFLATGHVVSPATHRGKDVELAIRASFDPVFAATKWKFADLHIQVAVRSATHPAVSRLGRNRRTPSLAE